MTLPLTATPSGECCGPSLTRQQPYHRLGLGHEVRRRGHRVLAHQRHRLLDDKSVTEHLHHGRIADRVRLGAEAQQEVERPGVVLEQGLRGLAVDEGGRVEADADVPRVVRDLVESHPDQHDGGHGVRQEAEVVGALLACGVVQVLQSRHQPLVVLDGPGRLVLRRGGVPPGPDRLALGGLAPQRAQHHLGAAAEVGQHVAQPPLGGAARTDQLLLPQCLDEPRELVVVVTERGDRPVGQRRHAIDPSHAVLVQGRPRRHPCGASNPPAAGAPGGAP